LDALKELYHSLVNKTALYPRIKMQGFRAENFYKSRVTSLKKHVVGVLDGLVVKNLDMLDIQGVSKYTKVVYSCLLCFYPYGYPKK